MFANNKDFFTKLVLKNIVLYFLISKPARRPCKPVVYYVIHKPCMSNIFARLLNSSVSSLLSRSFLILKLSAVDGYVTGLLECCGHFLLKTDLQNVIFRFSAIDDNGDQKLMYTNSVYNMYYVRYNLFFIKSVTTFVHSSIRIRSSC